MAKDLRVTASRCAPSGPIRRHRVIDRTKAAPAGSSQMFTSPTCTRARLSLEQSLQQ